MIRGKPSLHDRSSNTNSSSSSSLNRKCSNRRNCSSHLPSSKALSSNSKRSEFSYLETQRGLMPTLLPSAQLLAALSFLPSHHLNPERWQLERCSSGVAMCQVSRVRAQAGDTSTEARAKLRVVRSAPIFRHAGYRHASRLDSCS